MGPRARARGNMADISVDMDLAALQWGHERALVEMQAQGDLNSASAWLQWGHERALVEMQPDGTFVVPAATLQWGHERALVEMRWRGAACWIPLSFNGATSARLWK